MPRPPKLIVLSSQHRGLQFELTNDMYTLGRGDDRDICIKDPTVSTHHCDFLRSGASYAIRDNDSTNGTSVNDEKLKPGVERPLINSDLVRVGGVEVIFDSEDKQPGSTTTRDTFTGIIIPPDANPKTQVLQSAAPAIDEAALKQAARPANILKLVLIILGVIIVILSGLMAYKLMI